MAEKIASQTEEEKSSTTRTRLVIGLVVVPFLVIVAIFISIPWIVSDPLAIVRPNAIPVFLNEEETAGIRVNHDGQYVFAFESRSTGEPLIELGMPQHAVTASPSNTTQVAPGRFQASGQLGMPGRWSITVQDGDPAQVFEFILAEY